MGQRHPQLSGFVQLRQFKAVGEVEIIALADDAQQLDPRPLDGHTMPSVVLALLPGIDRLTVQFVQMRLGDLQVFGIGAGQKEVHIVNRAVGLDQIDAGELHALAEVGQIPHVDPDKAQFQRLALIFDDESALVAGGFFFDVRFNLSRDLLDGKFAGG